MSNSIASWMTGKSLAGLGGDSAPPPLAHAFAVYLGLFAPLRGTVGDPLADFANVLRDADRDGAYSDEEWVAFLLPFVGGDPDRARDLWDGLLCQP